MTSSFILLSVAWALIYLVCAWLAGRRLPPAVTLWPDPPPVSVLKPVAGLDADAEANFRSFFRQRYPGRWELIFALASPADPAVDLLRRLCREHPQVEARIVFAPPRGDQTGKMSNVAAAYAVARHPLIVISDSDMRVAPDFLHRLVSPLRDPRVDLVGALPIYVQPGSRWAQALCVYAHLFALCFGAVIAPWQLPGKFAAGNQAMRRELIEAIGGFERLAGYLCEDVRLAILVQKRRRRIEYAALATSPVGNLTAAALIDVLARYQLGSWTLSLPLYIFTCLLVGGHWLWAAYGLLSVNRLGWPLYALWASLPLLARAHVAWSVHRRWAGPIGWWRILAASLLLDAAFALAGLRIMSRRPIRWRGRSYRVLADGRVSAADGL